jgi:hypothetical protein
VNYSVISTIYLIAESPGGVEQKPKVTTSSGYNIRAKIRIRTSWSNFDYNSKRLDISRLKNGMR